MHSASPHGIASEAEFFATSRFKEKEDLLIPELSESPPIVITESRSELDEQKARERAIGW